MDRDTLRARVADAIGNPSSGPLADAVDRIVDAILEEPKAEKRITKPAETRGE
jgi:hypothetical protein